MKLPGSLIFRVHNQRIGCRVGRFEVLSAVNIINLSFAMLDDRDELRTACAEVGRDPASLQKTIACFVAFPGSDECPGGIHANALVGTPDEVAQRFKAFYDAGVDHITLFASPWGLKAVAALGQTIRILRDMGI